MKVYTKIDVPDGEYCRNLYEKEDECSRLGWEIVGRWCSLCQKKSNPGVMKIQKLPECLALPEALPCGHHPDAMTKDRLADDGYGFSWCVACAKEQR